MLGLANLHASTDADAEALQSALDLDGIWHAARKLLCQTVRHVSLSMLFDFDRYEHTKALHDTRRSRDPDSLPAASLTVSGPFLDRHPQIRMYTYSQIVAEDDDAPRRLKEQEPDPEWREFVHLAFWNDERPDTVLSLRRPPECSVLSDEEWAVLESLHPMIDAGLKRVRMLQLEDRRRRAYEGLLKRMPTATLLLDHQGHLLFATPEGGKQCQRWNRGLRAVDGCAQLPSRLVQSLAGGDQTMTGVKLRHPCVKGFSVSIERKWQTPSLRQQAAYVVTFSEEPVGVDGEADARGTSQEAWLALQKLSKSERAVALLAARGMSNEEIARHRCRSPRTIEYQLYLIFRKLDIRRRTQLVRLLS